MKSLTTDSEHVNAKLRVRTDVYHMRLRHNFRLCKSEEINNKVRDSSRRERHANNQRRYRFKPVELL